MKKSRIILNILLASCILAILIMSLYAYIMDIKHSNVKHKFDIVPKITEDFDKTELNKIKEYKNDIIYDSSSKEIIYYNDSEETDYTIVGKYGKLYSSPLEIPYNDDVKHDTDTYKTSFGLYKIEYDEDGYDYLVNTTDNTKNKYDSIYPLSYYKDNTKSYLEYLVLEKGKKLTIFNYLKNESKELNDYYDYIYISYDDENKCNNYKNYLIAKKDNKYGIIDFNENIILNFEYDELYNYSDNDEYLALKDNKYGIINSKGEIIYDFEYDDIKYIDNYKIMLKNNRIGILYNNKLIVDYSIKYNYINLPEDISVSEDNLYIITSNDSYEFSNSYLNNTESYLINKKGKIKTIDTHLNRIYTYEKENEVLSYFYSINENNNKLLITVYDLDFYQYYAFSIPYDKAYKYSLDIENILNSDYYKVKLSYEVSKQLNNYYYIDLFNSQTVDESVLLKYFDNGYSFILNDNKELKIYKNDKLISLYENVSYYLGGYYFSKDNAVYEVTFQKVTK